MSVELTPSFLAHKLYDSYRQEIHCAITGGDYLAAGLRIWAYAFWLDNHPQLGSLHCGPGIVNIGRAMARKLIEGKIPDKREAEMFEAYVAQAQMKNRD